MPFLKVREILKAWLKEHCKDSALVDRVAADDRVMNEFVRGSGVIAELVFGAFGSRDRIVQAMKRILEIHGVALTKDPDLIKKLQDDARSETWSR
jgi:hypothetical protein